MGKIRTIGGSTFGLAMVVAEAFEGKSIIEFLGWSSLPSEIREWGRTLMWSFHHFAIWLPIVMGLLIIVWANWSCIKVNIKSKAWRKFAIFIILAISFVLSNFLPSNAQNKSVPEEPAGIRMDNVTNVQAHCNVISGFPNGIVASGNHIDASGNIVIQGQISAEQIQKLLAECEVRYSNRRGARREHD